MCEEQETEAKKAEVILTVNYGHIKIIRYCNIRFK